MVHLHQTLEEGVAIGTDDHESPILIRLRKIRTPLHVTTPKKRKIGEGGGTGAKKEAA